MTAGPAVATSFLDELAWRGLLHQQTAERELRDHLATPGRVAYAGFDPTADSLHVGHLVPVQLLRHWQQAGHVPIVVVGGGTGLIGDPSGRDDERSLLTRERVEANVASQRRILERLLDFDPARPNAAIVLNNLEWLDALGYVEVLRDVGKHFSVNEMMQRDSVKRRLEQREQGISYTEFSYVVLQAYDFLHLRRTRDCTVQLAGSDQYGNIVAGIDLIRREFGHDAPAFGVTAPLVQRSDGRKMSKSSGEAVWLSADTEHRTSPYQLYQYLINLPDVDASAWQRLITMHSTEAIAETERTHAAAPHERHAQRALARELVSLLHGVDVLASVEAATEALFSGDVRRLDEAMLAEVFADVPHSSHDRAILAGGGLSLVELLPRTTLAASKREAREFLGNGAISVNGERVGVERAVTSADLLPGGTILLRRGKKRWHATRWA